MATNPTSPSPTTSVDLTDSTKQFLEGHLPAKKVAPPEANAAAEAHAVLGIRLVRERRP